MIKDRAIFRCCLDWGQIAVRSKKKRGRRFITQTETVVLSFFCDRHRSTSVQMGTVTEVERGPRRLAHFLLRKSHAGTLLQIALERNSCVLAGLGKLQLESNWLTVTCTHGHIVLGPWYKSTCLLSIGKCSSVVPSILSAVPKGGTKIADILASSSGSQFVISFWWTDGQFSPLTLYPQYTLPVLPIW